MAARTLIATDADVRGLLGCAVVSRDRGSGQLVWLPPGVDRQLSERCRMAAKEQAEAFGHRLLDEVRPGGEPSNDGEGQTRLLLEAASIAAANGAETVLWAGATVADQRNGIDVDALAMLNSRAMLIERLARLDHPAHPHFRVEVPYADLSDRQLADLVLDMDLPIWMCWWWSLARGPRSVPGAEAARVEYERWDALLKEAGWRDGMPGPATIG